MVHVPCPFQEWRHFAPNEKSGAAIPLIAANKLSKSTSVQHSTPTPVTIPALHDVWPSAPSFTGGDPRRRNRGYLHAPARPRDRCCPVPIPVRYRRRLQDVLTTSFYISASRRFRLPSKCRPAST